MKRVIIESPYAGDVGANLAYARACLKDSLSRGEAPIASHLLYTQPGVLDDNKPDERALGIDAGHAWIASADLVVAYHDMGVTEGMQAGIRRAWDAGKKVQFRKLDDSPALTERQIINAQAMARSMGFAPDSFIGPSEGFTTTEAAQNG